METPAELARRLTESGGDTSVLRRVHALPGQSPRRVGRSPGRRSASVGSPSSTPLALPQAPHTSPAPDMPSSDVFSEEEDVTYADIERGFSRCYLMRRGTKNLRSSEMCREVERAGCPLGGKNDKDSIKLLNAWIREHFAEAIEDGRVAECIRAKVHHWRGFAPRAATHAGYHQMATTVGQPDGMP